MLQYEPKRCDNIKVVWNNAWLKNSEAPLCVSLLFRPLYTNAKLQLPGITCHTMKNFFCISQRMIGHCGLVGSTLA